MSDTRDALLRAIEESGLSIYRIAQDADISETCLHNIRKGAEPRTDTAERIALALGLEIVVREIPPPS